MHLIRLIFVALTAAGVLFFPAVETPAQSPEPLPELNPAPPTETVPATEEPPPRPIERKKPASARRFAGPTYPSDWSDLFEEDRDIFGSEKEEKYDVNALFVEIENWPGHYSRKIFWLYRYTDYPRYRSTRVLPFYYHLSSKGDNRQKTISPFYYNKIEGKRRTSAFWPVLPLPVVLWGRDKKERDFHAVLPFYYRQNETNGRLDRLSIYPLLYFHRADRPGEPGYTYSPLYLRGGSPRDRFFLTWGYYRSRTVTRDYSGDVEPNGQRVLKETRVSPFTYSRKTYAAPQPPGESRYDRKSPVNVERILATRPLVEVSAYSLFFIPLYVQKRTPGYDSVQAGLYYARKSRDGKSRSSYFIPFYSGKESPGRRTAYYSLFYILPLHYYNRNSSGTTRYSGLLYYRRHDAKGALQTNWFVPLWFYKRDQYLNIPLALYFSRTEKNSAGKAVAGRTWFLNYRHAYDRRDDSRSTWFFPFYFHKENREIRRSWSWLHYHYTKRAAPGAAGSGAAPGPTGAIAAVGEARAGSKGQPEYTTRSYGLFPPILPLYSYKKTPNYTSTNVAYLYYNKRDPKGKTLRRRLVPFYFYNRNPNSQAESWFYGPVQRGRNKKTGEKKLHVWPVYFSWNTDYNDPDRDIVRGSSTVANPLWYSKRKQTVEGGKNRFSSVLRVPIVPIFYAGKTDSRRGSYRRLLNTVWTRGSDGDMKKFWFMPFYWQSFEPGGYLHAFPFYHRPESKDPERGVSFGFLPPFYHRWAPGRDTFYLVNYYSSRDEKAKRSRTLFVFPLPFIYKSRDGIKRREFIFPYKYEYEDEDEYYRAILGVSLNQHFGLLKPALSFGQRGDTWHFDTEISVLLNLFSFEKRISFRAPALLRSGAARKEVEKAARAEERRRETKRAPPPPRLVRKFIWNKDDYREYWGWSALFGLLAHKKADGVNHHRVLPLYWLTWHEDNSEGITTVPGFYLNYKSKDARYFYAGILLLPLYAHQRLGESYTNVYPLFTFISSWDAERRVRKHRYLFGLAGWSSGRDESGSYVFPLYYHNRRTEGKVTTRRTFFPIYYRRGKSTALDGGGTLEDSLSWSLVHYNRRYSRIRRDSTGQRTLRTESKTYGLPLYYRRVRETRPLADANTPAGATKETKVRRESKTFIMGYYQRNSPEESYWTAAGLVSAGKNHKTGRSSFSMLFGLLGSSSQPGSGRTTLLPFYASSRRVSGKESDPEYYSAVDRWIPLAGLYNYQRVISGTGDRRQKEVSHWSVFFDYDSYEKKGEPNWSLWVPFIPFLYYGDKEKHRTTHNVFMGLLYHYHQNRAYGHTSHSSLWSLAKVKYGKNRFEARLLPLFSYGFRERISEAGELDYRKRRWWVFPLAYYRNTTYIFGDRTYYDTTHLNPIYYWKRDTNRDGSYSKKFFLTLFPLVYSKDVREKAGKDRGTGRDLFRRETTRMFLPLYYNSREALAGKTRRETLWLPGYYNRVDHELKHRTRFFLPGIYLKDTPTYSRRNFLYLYDTIDDSSRKYSATRFLFGTVAYSRTDDETRFSLLYRALYGVRYRNARDYNRNILWAYASRRGDDYHNSFVPFWYYDRTGERKTFSVLWPLWYDSTGPARDLQYAGAGLLWYHRYDRSTRSGRTLAGLGMIYAGSQKADRGYHSKGIFWNLLYQHQYETANRYNKTSILKGIVYSKVTDQHGNSWKRIMGVKFGYKKAGDR